MPNIQSDPQAFGLVTVGTIDFCRAAYEFDDTVVWADPITGEIFWADDSGCSCPIPFERFDRSNITKMERLQQLIDHLNTRLSNVYTSSDIPAITADIGELIMEVSDIRNRKAQP